MKGRLLMFAVLILGACATTPKDQVPPETMGQYFAESFKETPKPKRVPEVQRKKTGAFTINLDQNLTLTDIIVKEGMPTNNIIPRRKEQITIYKKEEITTVYYFRNNKLYSRMDYTNDEMEKLQADDEYPKNLFRELEAI